MILTCFIIFLITCGGAVLTYVYEKEDTLLARLAAGNCVGAAVFATLGFVIACFFGFSTVTVLAALLLTLLPLIWLATEKDLQKRVRRDWQRAKGKLDGANFQKLLRFAYYAGILIVLWLFFERAMLETKDGIFTGGSQNLGDLPFHLGAIFSFTEGNNFPPENPSYANAKFTYPFLADFVTACFVKLGAGAREGMLVQNVFFGFSLVVLLEKFTVKLTGNKLAGRLAPLLLLLSGGLGFAWFFKDYFVWSPKYSWPNPQGFFDYIKNILNFIWYIFNFIWNIFDFLWKMPQDYTIGEKFRWGNSLVVLFLTQRSLLFGLPLTLIALMKIWDIFTAEKTEKSEEKINRDAQNKPDKKSFSTFHFPFSTFLVGLLAGMLPLIHVHSLAVLFVVCAFLFFFRLDRWRQWAAFAVGVAIVAVPELLWVMKGSASDLSKFIEWHFGWDSKNQNFFVFWAKNIGIFIPLLLVGLYLVAREENLRRGEMEMRRRGEKNSALSTQHSALLTPHSSLLLFYLPFAFLFLVSNTLKLAPWEWDNIKVLIYWFTGSLPLVAFVLAWLWEKTGIFKLTAAVCFIALTLSGALDVWRTISGQTNYKIFDKDAVKLAEQIKQKTAPNALFLNAATYNSAVVLAGRRSLMRYSGHLSSYGIDYETRENELRRIYEGTALADRLLQKNNIEYVIISPEERGYAQDPYRPFMLNEEFFHKFPVIAEVGQYKVFKVK